MARKRIKPVVKYFVVGKSSFTVRQDGLPKYSQTHNNVEGITKWLNTEIWTDAEKVQMVRRFYEVLNRINPNDYSCEKHEHGGYLFVLPGNENAGPKGKPITDCSPKDRIGFYVLCSLLAKESSKGKTGKPSKKLIEYRTPQKFLDKLDEIEEMLK